MPDYTSHIQQLEQTLQTTPVTDTISLMNGKGSLVLLYAYLYKTYGNEAYFYRYSHLLDECLAIVSTQAVPDTLADGLAGILWLFRHLIDMDLLSEENEELLDVWEKQLIGSLEKDITSHNYDLIHGLTGKCHYFLHSLHKPVSHKVLSEVVHHLKEWAVPFSTGLGWLDYSFASTTEKGLVNLGMAHGVPSIIAFLSHLYQAGIEKETVQPLLEQAVCGLLSQQRTGGTSSFPVVEGVQEESRLAWCYGDMGPILALFAAAKTLHRADWHEQAVSVATLASKRTVVDAGLGQDVAKGYIDGGFCHGVCGISHIFYRIYQHTQLPVFAQTADYWLSQVWTNPAYTAIGYLFPNRHQKTQWQTDPSLLMGTTGLIMTLLAQQNPDYTHWDTPFMTTL